MSIEVANSLFIRSSLKRYTGAFYQRVLLGVSSFRELGNRLIHQAQIGHAFRRVSVVEEAATLLSSLPLKEYQSAGQYYLAWCARRGSNNDLTGSEALLENVARSATTQFKAGAILSLGAVSGLKGDSESQLHYYLESIKAARASDVSTIVEAHQGIAILKARERSHKSALKDLEQLLPLARYSDQLVYHDFLNSYAVELTTAGRINEACNITKVLLASPFVSAYPEWHQTLAEVRTKHKQRSSIAISRPQIEPESEDQTRVPNNPINSARIRAVIDFMAANLHRKIALPELAKIVNLSSRHFCNVFKAETGVPPGQYLIGLRMERAGQLLTTTFLSIKQIMAEVGYYNKSNFGRSFKSHFEVTPSEYRALAYSGGLTTQRVDITERKTE